MDIIIKLLFIIIGISISGIGYLIKRSIEKRSNVETLERRKKVLEIHKQMNEQGLDFPNLLKLESQLVSKQKSIAKNTLEFEQNSKSLVNSQSEESLTQNELNARASQKFEDAKAKLQIILEQLSSKLGKSEKEALKKSQRAWEEYSIEQAFSASSSYSQGSIYPLIYFSELESLTLERAARLKAELDELIKLGN
jgi:uncharacterized protein YecT (DUF1311 family)